VISGSKNVKFVFQQNAMAVHANTELWISPQRTSLIKI